MTALCIAVYGVIHSATKVSLFIKMFLKFCFYFFFFFINKL